MSCSNCEEVNYRKVKSPQEQKVDLVIASRFLVYSIRLYYETLIWLLENQAENKGWDTIRNSIIETHLSKSRLLIEFINKCKKKGFQDDRFALSFFRNTGITRYPLRNWRWFGNIRNKDKNVAHLTIDPTGKIQWKGDVEFDIINLCRSLIPKLIEFYNLVNEEYLHEGTKEIALEYLFKANGLTSSLDYGFSSHSENFTT